MTMQRVQMLLEPQQRRKLAELAKTQGKSIAEVTRQAIDMGLAQMAQDDPRTSPACGARCCAPVTRKHAAEEWPATRN